jgi:hypothetical protein
MGGVGRRIDALERLYGRPLSSEVIEAERARRRAKDEEVLAQLHRVIEQEVGDPALEQAPLAPEEEEMIREFSEELFGPQ